MIGECGFRRFVSSPGHKTGDIFSIKCKFYGVPVPQDMRADCMFLKKQAVVYSFRIPGWKHLRSDFGQAWDMVTIKKHVIKRFDNAPESFFIIAVDAAHHNLSPPFAYRWKFVQRSKAPARFKTVIWLQEAACPINFSLTGKSETRFRFRRAFFWWKAQRILHRQSGRAVRTRPCCCHRLHHLT